MMKRPCRTITTPAIVPVTTIKGSKHPNATSDAESFRLGMTRRTADPLSSTRTRPIMDVLAVITFPYRPICTRVSALRSDAICTSSVPFSMQAMKSPPAVFASPPMVMVFGTSPFQSAIWKMGQ